MRYPFNLTVIAFALLLTMALGPKAQAQQVLYDDSLQNGWVSYGWAQSLSYTNTSPVHSGSDSISVQGTAYQAVYLYHNDFDTTLFGSLTFWVYGGASGGQKLQVLAKVSGTIQTPYPFTVPTDGAWHQVTVPLSAIGAANANLDGIIIQDISGQTFPAFYVDDISLTATTVPQPTLAHLSVNAGQTVRSIDPRLYGVNTACWDGSLGTAATLPLLSQIQAQDLRFPGGSSADVYTWSSPGLYNTPYATFANIAEAAQAQTVITANYGTGTPQMAAAWVAYTNGSPSSPQVLGTDTQGVNWRTVGYWASLRAAVPLASDDGLNFLRDSHPAPFTFHQDWEIGNECYGGWESDQHGVAGSGLTGAIQDPTTYAQYFTQFYTAMKAVSPSIKIGFPGAPGEDSYGGGPKSVPNPNEGNSLHSGWTAVILASLAAQGVTPDFVVDHRYPQGPGSESDATLLVCSAAANPSSWQNDALSLRKMLTDYSGAAGAGISLLATESNSITFNPGKQSTSLVNGLFLADSLGCIAQTEFNACDWWDLRNGANTGNNNSASLYGWRQFGDYGLVAAGDRSDTPVNTPYPTFYAAKLLTHWGRGGDQVVAASSDYSMLAVYAAKLSTGGLALLVINKDPNRDLTGRFALTGFVPGSAAAAVYQYGKPQDTANADVVKTSISNAGAGFDEVFPSYSMSVIVLAPAAAPTTLSVSPATGTQGQTAALSGTLKTGSGTALSGKTLTFQVDGTAVGTAVTSSTGVASLVYAIPAATAAGSHPITAAFAGDGANAASSGTGSLSVSAAPPLMNLINDTNSTITYTGTGWFYNAGRSFGDVGSDVHATTVNGDSVSYTFTGTAVSYLAETYVDEGTVQVYIDGVLKQTVNCSTSARLPQQSVYSITGLSLGAHTIKLVKTGGSYMLLDAFQVTPAYSTTVNDTNSAITYTGSGWFSSTNRGLSDISDDVHATTVNGDSVSYTFTGTAVSYLAETYVDEGTVQVYVDGVLQATVNCSTAARLSQQSIYNVSGLTAGSHTIKLVKTGGSYMLLDALSFQ